MVPSRCWEGSSSSAGPEISRILCNLKVIFLVLSSYRVYVSMSVYTVTERSQLLTLSTREHHLSLSRARLIPNHVDPVYFLKIDLDFVFHLRPCLQSCLFPSTSPTKTLTHFYSPPYHVHATCPAHLILNDWIIRIIFDEFCSRSSLLYTFLQPPATPSLYAPNFLLSTLSRRFPSCAPPRGHCGIFQNDVLM